MSAFGTVASVRDIGGDVLAGDAVAARGAQHEPAVLVAERGREPVDLGLGHHRDRRLFDPRHILGRAEEIADGAEEGAHLVLVEGVVERQHRRRMPHLGEAGGGRGADAARRAVGADEVGKALLDRVIAPAQRVILGVRDLGRVLLVIEPVVVRDRGGQPLQLPLRLGLGESAVIAGSA